MDLDVYTPKMMLRGEISEGDIVLLARREFAWIEDSNIYRLKGIAMFYARK